MLILIIIKYEYYISHVWYIYDQSLFGIGKRSHKHKQDLFKYMFNKLMSIFFSIAVHIKSITPTNNNMFCSHKSYEIVINIFSRVEIYHSYNQILSIAKANFFVVKLLDFVNIIRDKRFPIPRIYKCYTHLIV